MSRSRAALRCAFAAACLAAACLVDPAAAQDVLLEVPVRVAEVPPSTRVGSVSCTVFSDPDGHTINLGYLGTGAKWFLLKDGGFAGKVTVAVNYDPDKKGPAKSYRCALYFIFKQGERVVTLHAGRSSDPTMPEYRPQFRAARDAKLVYEVRGTFP